VWVFSKKNKIHVVNFKHKTQTTRHIMLQTFPAHTVHSAMHFQDLAYWAPEPVAKGKNARQRSGIHVEAEGEEEDYVFV
jgi:hypothetical protein